MVKEHYWNLEAEQRFLILTKIEKGEEIEKHYIRIDESVKQLLRELLR